MAPHPTNSFEQLQRMEHPVRKHHAEDDSACTRALERFTGYFDDLREWCMFVIEPILTLTPWSQIALFSAIVTTFYIQASNNLSPNPAVQTNVLLANLTNIIVAATLNTNHLSPQPIIRDPIREVDAATIRLNFYWSTSLILSVSFSM